MELGEVGILNWIDRVWFKIFILSKIYMHMQSCRLEMFDEAFYIDHM